MQFRTEVHPNKIPFEIHLKDRILSIGSCFSENIGLKLQKLGMNIQINPNGILFNPHSIAQNLQDIINNNPCNKEDLVQHDNLWHSWKHHGKFSKSDQGDALKKMNKSLSDASENLGQTKILIITFGSAWVYKHHSYGIVANCHKVPQSNFSKELLTSSEIVSTWSKVLQILEERVPDLEVIFTLSPVRHWKDSAEGNSLSKAILRSAIESIIGTKTNRHYFPSYELIMDDLRDYRWFKDDMLHPSDAAINYVWRKFSNAFFTEEQLAYIKELEKLQKLKEHKGIHQSTNALKYEEKRKMIENKFAKILNHPSH